MTVVSVDSILGNIGNKYDVTDHIVGMQHDPSDMSTTNFKQEYTVVIRKKKYYAATAGTGKNDQYIRMYQIDNFNSISISNSVNGTSPGSCRLSMIGGTKVICADRSSQDSNGWGSGETGFFSMLANWSQNLNDNTTTMEPNGDYIYKNMLFDNIDDMKKIKYGWRIAEKCDIEPMDEIYVYGKSRKVKDGDKYKIYQLFFGYISDVSKSYAAGKTMPMIQISAVDHLKLLQISYIANTPALDYNVAFATAHYNTDSLGNLIIDDDPESTEVNAPEIKASFFTNVFAGKYPYEIIIRCAKDAGIPDMYLQKRIELVKRIPFLPTLKTGSPYELFQSDTQQRLMYCNDAADKLYMEFFADEEGNLVFKIPNYTLGVNKCTANNAYIEGLLTKDEAAAMSKTGLHSETVTTTSTTYETVTETLSSEVTHTVVTGDTLWDLASSYLGDSSLWPQIYAINTNIISNPHWIYPGQVIHIKKGVTSSKQVPKLVNTTSTKQVDGGTLSSITDKYIPVIKDNEILSFVVTDSDSQVVNGFQINQELSNGMVGEKIATTRVVQDWGSIIRFGIRMAKVINTPLLNDQVGAELFGTMMVQRSLSQRYRGTLNMIEESSIRVGNPIRVFLYDEHPYKFSLDQAQYGPQQAIFYVESIGRNITSDGVSTMALTLSAGRVMGMESTYDKMQLLYKGFYDEAPVITWTQGTDPSSINSSSGSSSSGNASSSGYDSILTGTLNGHGAEIIAAANKYNIDPALFAAITMAETGGSSSALNNYNNPAGIMDWNNNWKTVKKFDTLADGIDFAASNLKSEYINKGLTTIEQIGAKYCPVGAANDPNGLNANWISNVHNYYDRFSKASSTSGGDTSSSLAGQLVTFAMTLRGTPYVYGGTSISGGFDCSGLVQYVYAHFGKKITRVTTTQILEGVYVSKDQLQEGDIVFFGDSIQTTDHEAMYVGDGYVIEAPHTGDVVKTIALSVFTNYLCARRILS